MEVHAPRRPSAEARAAVGLKGEAADLALLTAADFGDLAAANRGERPYTPAQQEAMRAVYDASLWELDRVTGALLDALDQRGHRDDTLVVVVSDHGDEIGEHGLYGHNFAIYDTLVHVPLLLRGPGVAPGHRTAPTSTAGLYGTLASLAGIPVEGALTLESAPPVAELTAVHGVKTTLPERDATGAYIANRRRFTAIYQDHWKLIRSTADERELYDLARDPGETTNLAGQDPERTAAMEAAMDAWILATPRAPDGPLPQAERKRRKAARVKRTDDEASELAALGYLE